MLITLFQIPSSCPARVVTKIEPGPSMLDNMAKSLAWLFTVYSLAVGLFYLYDPVTAAKACGLDLGNLQHNSVPDTSFVQMFAGRNIAISLMLSVFTLQRRYTAVGP